MKDSRKRAARLVEPAAHAGFATQGLEVAGSGDRRGNPAREHLSGSASPTERTMAWLRGQGFTVDKVEHRVRFGKVTRDLFGCIDVVAMKAGWPGLLGVQATTTAHLSERVTKIRGEARARLWLACGNHLWAVGWALGPGRGSRRVFRPTVVNMAAHMAL